MKAANAHDEQGPGLQSFLKVTVTLTVREIIVCLENLRLMSVFRTTLGISRFSTPKMGSQAFIFITIISITVYKQLRNFSI